MGRIDIDKAEDTKRSEDVNAKSDLVRILEAEALAVLTVLVVFAFGFNVWVAVSRSGSFSVENIFLAVVDLGILIEFFFDLRNSDG